MKKLFSLIFVALISSQMWATTYSKVNVSAVNGTIVSKQYASSISGYKFSISSTVRDGYYVWITATPTTSGATCTWTVTGGRSLSDCTQTNEGGNFVLRFTMPTSDVTVTATFAGGSGSGSGGGSRSSVVATKTASAKSATVNRTGSGSGKTVNYALPDGVVDMGTAGYWSEKNVGGQYTTSTGKYFQWGSIIESRSSSYTFPTTADLVSTTDAATAITGTGYCTPTKDEWNALLNTTNYTWTYNDSRYVEKYTITSKSTGNSIDLPANTGYYDNNSNTSTGSGCYWTSTYNNGNPYTFLCNGSTKGFYGLTSSASAVAWVTGKNNYALFIRPIYNMTGTLYTLTINVVDGSNTYTYKYKGASGQVVNVSVQSVSGYNAAWNDAVSTASARQFTLTSDITKTVTYTSAGSTVSFAVNNSNYGSLSSSTSITGVSSGTQISVSGSSVTIGSTTITAMPTEATAQYTYDFTGWTDGSGDPLPATVTGNLTIRANFSQTENNYSVTFRTSEDDANPAVKSDYHYGDEITNCPAIDPQKIGDETHTYTFLGWYLDNTDTRYEAGMTVSGNMIFTARFDEQIIEVVPVTYNVTIGSFAANGKVIITSQDNVREITATGATLTFDAGKSLTIQAVPNAYYHFAGWTEDNDEEAVIDIRTLNEDLTYTPTFDANEPLTLEDTHNEAYYSDLYNQHDGDVLTVTLANRQLTEGNWITFCAPFDFTIPAGHPFYGTAYLLQNATMSGSNTSAYISLDFRRTYEIRANVPYLIVPTMTTMSNLEFDGVTIEEAPTVRTTAAQSGQVEFVSVPWQTKITNDATKPNIYLASGNTLRYVSTAGTTFRAFRAYFHRVVNLGAPRRMVISLDGVETTKQLTEDGEVTDTTEKRLENGVLIIERNGVRYNAQGAAL